MVSAQKQHLTEAGMQKWERCDGNAEISLALTSLSSLLGHLKHSNSSGLPDVRTFRAIDSKLHNVAIHEVSKITQ